MYINMYLKIVKYKYINYKTVNLALIVIAQIVCGFGCTILLISLYGTLQQVLIQFTNLCELLPCEGLQTVCKHH